MFYFKAISGKETNYFFLFFLLFFFGGKDLKAEGSIDLAKYPGYRLFYDASVNQQLKVYAEEGDFLHFGASHLGVEGGFMEIYRPDGSLHSTFDGSNNQGIIYNEVQEANGPNGGGIINGQGFQPNIIPVTGQEAGVWTIVMDYPNHAYTRFNNLLNSAPWTRAIHQPTNKRVILAWDISVSKNAPINEGGIPIKGRLYTNELISIIQGNGVQTSPTFYVLAKEGYQYQVNFNDTDPFGFPFGANNLGIVNGNATPAYQSANNAEFSIDSDVSNWNENELYIYPLQEKDTLNFINHKIFFNQPDTNLPTTALTSNVFSNQSYQTWLFNIPAPFIFDAFGVDSMITLDSLSADFNIGHIPITYQTSQEGVLNIAIDINNNSIFTDPIDVHLTSFTPIGEQVVFWDGKNGLGNFVDLDTLNNWPVKLTIQTGEIHIFYRDIENDGGGITINRLSEGNFSPNDFYYNHSTIGGPVSGGGTPENPLPTTMAYTYGGNFGNEKLLDHWTYANFETTIVDLGFDLMFRPDTLDTDQDGIVNREDVDDDNDGIPDSQEIELATNNGDSDLDGIPDYLDSDSDNDGISDIIESGNIDSNNDSSADGADANMDGHIDNPATIEDTDEDTIPNYLDSDSDNDGISDILESGNVDVNNDGSADGADANMDGHIDNPATIEDTDEDTIPNYLDSDSDNDGISDILESGNVDVNNDGSADGADANMDGHIDNPATIEDTDEDTIPNYLDSDSDNDGISDILESGNVDVNNDGSADGADANMDGHIDNPATIEDTDEDTIPNYLDSDSDNDGISDILESGNVDANNDGSADGEDANMDGHIDSPATIEDTDEDTIPNYLDSDSDNDGISDILESGNVDVNNDGSADGADANMDGHIDNPATIEDTDEDTIPNYLDSDSDNDGISDILESGNVDANNDGSADGTDANMDGHIDSPATIEDTDEDTIPNYLDSDSDNDGISDILESGNIDANNDGSADGADANMDGHIDSPATIEDTDEDTIPNYLDSDSDNDGISDILESGNVDANNDGSADGTDANMDGHIDSPATIEDTDEDTIPNYLDSDSDNDGISDILESGNVDANNDGSADGTDANMDGHIDNPATIEDTDEDTTPNYLDSDSDNDGISDILESGNIDANNDGSADGEDANMDGHIDNPTTIEDTDEDTLPNYLDSDSDNDGISDVLESGNVDVNNDGSADGTDANMDGHIDSPATIEDTDEDTIPNYLDSDSDNDGISDILESGNIDANNDGSADGADANMDGHIDNPATIEDTDEDTIPNYLDSDSDNDGISDILESGNVDVNNDGSADGADANMDGHIDNPATIEDTDEDTIPNYLDSDSDNDGISDILESGNVDANNDGSADGEDANMDGHIDNPATIEDTDEDTIPNYLDSDSDNDGISDILESGNVDANNDGSADGTDANMDGHIDSPATIEDTDEDTIPNYLDSDSDNDGISDILESGNIDANNDGSADGADANMDGHIDSPATIEDTDEDTIPNYLDSDSDNDGYTDTEECSNGIDCPDFDKDGMPDFIDSDCSALSIPSIEIITSDSVFCMSNNFLLTGINQNPSSFLVNYTWSGPNGTLLSEQNSQIDTFSILLPDVDDFQQGWFVLSLTSQQGECSTVKDSIFIDELPSPVPSELEISKDSICAGSDVVLTVDVATSLNITGYDWYFSKDTTWQLIEQTAFPFLLLTDNMTATTGLYRVETIVENCSSILSNEVSLFVYEPIMEVIANNSSTSQSTTCIGDSIVFEVNPIPNASYRWIGPGIDTIPTRVFTIDSLTAANEGAFYVQVQVGNCYNSVSNLTSINFTTPTPEPIIAVVDTICLNSTLTLSLSNEVVSKNFDWFKVGGNAPVANTTIPELTFAQLNLADAGTYFVRITDGVCGTPISASVEVAIRDTQIIGAEIFTLDTFTCSADALALSGNHPEINNGFWSSLDGGQFSRLDTNETTISDLAIGSNQITWTIQHPKCGTISVDTLTIIRYELPNILADAGLDQTFCGTDSTVLAATNPTNELANGFWESLGQAVIVDSLSANTKVSNLSIGNNLLVWNISDANCGLISTDTLQITVIEQAEILLVQDTFYLPLNDTLKAANVVANDNLVIDSLMQVTLNSPEQGTIISDDKGVFTYVAPVDFIGEIPFSYTVCQINCSDNCDSTQVTLIIEGQLPCPDSDGLFLDTDGDGIINQIDLDSDNDGIPDVLEMCVDTTNCTFFGIDPDKDNDGDCIVNYLDADDPSFRLDCEDLDMDGRCDFLPFSLDVDGDNIPNHLDLDSDNDGISDLIEARPFYIDLDGNGRLDGAATDFGQNGLLNSIATDADELTALIIDEINDADKDGVPNYKDLDSDNDGLSDIQEGSLRIYDLDFDGRIDNAARNTTVNSDGLATVIDPESTGLPIPIPADTDGDGVYNFIDHDSDNDGIGDAPEGGHPDEDRNGFIGTSPLVISELGYVLSDANGAIYDEYGPPADTDGDGVYNFIDHDSDNDGIGDAPEGGHPDEDRNGFIGTSPLVISELGYVLSDANGAIYDEYGPPSDTDGDGVYDFIDHDSDNDGIGDAPEGGHPDEDRNGFIGTSPLVISELGYVLSDANGAIYDEYGPPADTDGDGVYNFIDHDSDNDGIGDAPEGGHPDEDRNGFIGTSPLVISELGYVLSDANGAIYDEYGPPADTDGDGVYNFIDHDSDNDGIGDAPEGGHPDEDRNGFIGTSPLVISELGYVLSDANGAIYDEYAPPADTDGDGVYNFIDHDSDNDGIGDAPEGGHPDEDRNGFIGTSPLVISELGYVLSDANGAIYDEYGPPADTDGDGVYNFIDHDSDNDGIGDAPEGGHPDEDRNGFIGTSPLVISELGYVLSDANGAIYDEYAPPADTDGDGVYNFIDHDSDNDGIGDAPEGGHPDEDRNGFIGTSPLVISELGYVLSDANGAIYDEYGPPSDTDGDGVYNFIDHDSDNDGIGDAPEGGHPDEDRNGFIGTSPLVISELGYVLSDANGAIYDEYAPPADTDGDGVYNFIDHDSDNDGIGDAPEGGHPDEDRNGFIGTSPLVISELGYVLSDANGAIYDEYAPPADTDGDGVYNFIDHDSDNDGIGDAPEGGHPDEDRNGFIGTSPLVISELGYVLSDANGAIYDEYAPPADTDGDGVYNFIDHDSDNDGIGDAPEGGHPDEDRNGFIGTSPLVISELGYVLSDANGNVFALYILPIDTDGDGIFNFSDLDSDNDGVNDVLEMGGVDLNGDGLNDGVFDPMFGVFGILLNPIDTDGDGINNALDLDSDNDGVGDLVENGMEDSDANMDGLVDGIDTDGDGILDLEDGLVNEFGDQADDGLLTSDTDSLPDYIDLDSDNDGISDLVEQGLSHLDSLGTGQLSLSAGDNDEDGILDVIDQDSTVFGGIGPADTDNDGLANAIDLDSDNDGIPDSIEISFAINNGDSDEDGIPDYLDLDADNDGIPDVVESGNIDDNGDGMVDGVDENMDGIIDEVATIEDTDGDGVPNYKDLDSDNDGVSDVTEGGFSDYDVNNDGVIEESDLDGDGIADSIDNLPNAFGNQMAMPPTDKDMDGIPDGIDTDSDNDGLSDLVENGYGAFDSDNDGVFDGMMTDMDGDGILNVFDNDTIFGGIIPLDFDQDGVIDLLDLDTDGDGIADSLEILLARFDGDSDMDGIPDYLDLDSDNDGFPDVLENGGLDENQDGKLDGIDANGDGIKDVVIPMMDTDMDGVPDYLDLDSDNDGVFDVIEVGLTDTDGNGIVGAGSIVVDGFGLAQTDTMGNSTLITFENLDSDGDGNSNYNDSDSDNDSIFDTHENEVPDGDNDGIAGTQDTVNIYGVIDSLGTNILIDTDEDGIPNFIDTDSDNDHFLDIVECPNFEDCPDFDEDGVPDYLDMDCSELSLPEIAIVQSANQFCEGDTLNLKAINQNSTPFPVKYEWQDPNAIMVSEESSLADTFMLTTSLLEKSQEGWYRFQIKSLQGECPVVSDSIFISLSTMDERRPELSFANDTICPSNTITLIANHPNLSPIAYEWYINKDTIPELLGQTTIATFTPNELFSDSTSFQVATISETCPKVFSKVASIYVQDTSFNIIATNSSEDQLITCMGDEVDFSATTIPNASYRWFGPGIDTIYQQNFTLPVEMIHEGAFFVIVTIGDCYEKISNPTVIKFSELGMPPELETVSPICLGSPFTISVKNPEVETQYEWFNASNNQFIARTEQPVLAFAVAEQIHSGGYYVNAKNELCGDQSSQIIEIVVRDTMLPNVEIFTTDTTICTADTLFLEANTPQVHRGFWQTLDTGVFLNSDSNQTIVKELAEGKNRIIWTIAHEFCPNVSRDTIVITKVSAPTIAANAGVYQALCAASEIVLAAEVVDSSITAFWENVDGSEIVDNTNPNANVNLQPGLNQFSWNLSNEFCGVFSRDTANVWVDTIPSTESAKILTADTTICLGSEIITLLAESTADGISGNWEIPNTVDFLTKKDSTSIQLTKFPDTVLSFVWQISNGACINFDQDEVKINVLGNDLLDVVADEFELSFNDTLTEIDILENDLLPFDLGWSIEIREPFSGTVIDKGEGFIDYIPRENFYGTDQFVYVVCAANCPSYCDSTTVDLVVDVVDRNNDCFLPNIITPNGDGYNDAFVVPCLEKYPNNAIRIFNRWGDEVFSAAPYNNNWKGTYKFSPLPNGTYFYFISLSDDPLDQLSGYFTLYR